jgi:type IV pilus assembly protein PilV
MKRQFMNTCNVKEGRQSGMTLIETLVALLVLSIGLLGVAALQMTSLRNNHAAHTRSQATALAYDIADRMRANRTVAVGGGYNIALGALPGAPATLADIDILAWKNSLGAALPAGDGAITTDAAVTGDPNIVRITIRWDDSRGVEAPVQFVTDTRL